MKKGQKLSVEFDVCGKNVIDKATGLIVRGRGILKYRGKG
jgi:hypothetical protein|tara:strand:- start:1064 stop:1183 length:120 start_codon:yes stop_codon:yes gene_type:complete